jgi:hypothetical protein
MSATCPTMDIMTGQMNIDFESILISLECNHIRHLPQNQQYDNRNAGLEKEKGVGGC